MRAITAQPTIQKQIFKEIIMKITSLKNENGARVYHVVDCGCIQEFWTYKEAQQYVAYCLKDLKK